MSRFVVLLLCVFSFSNIGMSQNYQWMPQTTPTTEQLNVFSFVNEYQGYAAGFSGVVLKTENGGADWYQYSTPVTSAIVGIYFENLDHGVIYCTAGDIYETYDGAVTWDLIYSNSNALGDHMAEHNGRLFFGRDYDYLYTDDWGSSFDSVDVGFTYPEGITFVDNLVGFCAGGFDISKTTDGGNTWVLQSGLPIGGNTIWDIEASLSTVLTAVGSGSIVLRSTDAGQNWNPVSIPGTHTFYRVNWFNESHGIIVGSSDGVLETVDGGMNWTQTPTSSSNLYLDCFVANDNMAYICGTNGKIYRAPAVVDDIAMLNHLNPDTVCVGQPFNVSWEFTNIGGGPSFNPGFTVMESGQGSILGDTIYYTGVLDSGDVVTHTETGVVFSTSGTKNIVVTSTEQNNPNNNYLYFTIEVVEPDPFGVLGGTYFCPGDAITLVASGGNNYIWQDGTLSDIYSSIQVVYPTQTTAFAVEIEQDFCKVLDTVWVYLETNCDLDTLINKPATSYAFSPNYDGVNDYLVLDFIDPTSDRNQVTIYNRWGDVVFQTINYNNVDSYWDGTYGKRNSPPGTYFLVANTESVGEVKAWIQIVK